MYTLNKYLWKIFVQRGIVLISAEIQIKLRYSSIKCFRGGLSAQVTINSFKVRITERVRKDPHTQIHMYHPLWVGMLNMASWKRCILTGGGCFSGDNSINKTNKVMRV